MRPYIVRTVLLPLLLSSAASMVAAIFVQSPWRDLLINLSAGFVGSFVTIVYVDHFIERERKAQWETVRDRIVMRVQKLTNEAVTSVRAALGISVDTVNEREALRSQTAMRSEMIRLIRERVIPHAARVENVEKMNEDAWKTLVLNLGGISRTADQLIALFGRDLDPSIFRGLLDLQWTADKIVGWYLTFPDVFGIPSERVPPLVDGSSGVPHQHVINAIARSDLSDLVTTCARLLDSLPADSLARGGELLTNRGGYANDK